MKTVALLPMKAHSERVTGKNFKYLAGKPLFKWILDALDSCTFIDEIIINTDARQLLADNGLESTQKIKIRERRSDICGDHVSMNLIIEDDLSATDGDCYLMTHTTNPLLTSETMRAAFSEYISGIREKNIDSLFGVTRYQTRFYKDDGTPINHDPQNLIRTQDLEPWYEENSCIYIFDKSSFSATSARIGLRPKLFEIPKLEAIDIDDNEDWFLANALAKEATQEK